MDSHFNQQTAAAKKEDSHSAMLLIVLDKKIIIFSFKKLERNVCSRKKANPGKGSS